MKAFFSKLGRITSVQASIETPAWALGGKESWPNKPKKKKRKRKKEGEREMREKEVERDSTDSLIIQEFSSVQSSFNNYLKGKKWFLFDYYLSFDFIIVQRLL